jgi:glycosyltransferase involved in cell wall biosynthesis
MKIVHVIFSLNLGGTESMLIDIANKQVEKVSVSILIINNDYSLELIQQFDQRINIIFIHRIPGSRNINKIILLNLKLSMKFDVIHCHDSLVAGLLLFTFKKKLCLTIHNTTTNSRYFQKYNILFSISKAVQKEIFNRTKFNSTLVYNGVELEKIKKQTNPQVRNQIRIVQIGRLVHDIKGQDVLITAVVNLLNKGYNIKLDFIGEGQSLKYLKEKVSELKTGKNINFLGLKSRAYVYQNLCEYDILVQPSINEGFGLTIVEAFAAGVGVVTSNIDGPKELINLMGTGEMFMVGNSIDCSNKIEKLIINPYKYSTVFYNQLSFLFDVKNTALKYLECYKTAL